MHKLAKVVVGMQFKRGEEYLDSSGKGHSRPAYYLSIYLGWKHIGSVKGYCYSSPDQWAESMGRFLQWEFIRKHVTSVEVENADARRRVSDEGVVEVVQCAKIDEATFEKLVQIARRTALEVYKIQLAVVD